MTDQVALAYLEASDAAAICIVRSETGCTFRTGLTGPGDVIAIYWLPGAVATAAIEGRRLACRRTQRLSPVAAGIRGGDAESIHPLLPSSLKREVGPGEGA
jgi:hypothetical protein